MFVQNALADTVTTISLGHKSEYLGVNPTTNKIYASLVDGGAVSTINGATNTVVGSITVGYGPEGVGVNPVTNKIYVANQDNSISVINGTIDKVIGTVPVNYPWSVGVNPVTNKIYVDSPRNGIYIINGTTDSVITTIPSTNPGGIGVNPSTDKIYVTNPLANMTSVIDGTTDKVIDTIPGINPWSVGVNPVTNKIYIANIGDDTTSVIDGTTDRVIATVPVGSHPDSIGVNPSTDKIFVANAYDNTVSIIDGSTNSIIATIPVGNNPHDVGVNPTTNMIYVDNFNDKTITVISDNGSPQPPTNLTATAISSSQINLIWNAPASNGGSDITGYMIQRSTDGGATWSTIVSNSDSTSTAYSDTGLAASTTYTYQVSAINSAGTSAPSNTASATTSGITIASGIVLNNVQSTSGTTSSSNQVTLSGFNAGTGSNQLLLVGVSANNNSPVSVTFNGMPLTQAVSSFFNNDAEFWYLKNPSGTGNIVVTMSGPTQAVVGAYSFSGVSQTSPIPATVTGHNTSVGSPTISITAKYTNDLVLDLPSIWGGVTLGSPTCTQQWDANVPNAITGASSSTIVQSPTTVACKWTASSADLWDDVAVELKAAG